MNDYVSNFGESMMNMWKNNVDRLYSSQKEAVENLLNQTFTTQKEYFEKIAESMGFIESEQKKLITEIRDFVKQNIQTVYGDQASDSFDKWNAKLDELNDRIQQLSSIPLKQGQMPPNTNGNNQQ
jgi:phage-related protein